MSITVDEAKRKEDLAGWVAEAKARGYKPTWAAYQYKDNYGGWAPKAWLEELGAGFEGKTASAPRQSTPGICPTCGHDSRPQMASRAAQAPKSLPAGYGGRPDPGAYVPQYPQESEIPF